jgi:hypothetical protein
MDKFSRLAECRKAEIEPDEGCPRGVSIAWAWLAIHLSKSARTGSLRGLDAMGYYTMDIRIGCEQYLRFVRQ